MRRHQEMIAMTKKWIFLAALAASTPAQAYMFGNPGRAVGPAKAAVSLVYDTSDRDMEAGGRTVGLEVRRLYAEVRGGIGQGLEWIARGTPATGRLQLDNSSFNPAL